MGKKDFKLKLDQKELERVVVDAKGVEIECPTCHEKVVVRKGITKCPHCQMTLRFGR